MSAKIAVVVEKAAVYIKSKEGNQHFKEALLRNVQNTVTYEGYAASCKAVGDEKGHEIGEYLTGATPAARNVFWVRLSERLAQEE